MTKPKGRSARGEAIVLFSGGLDSTACVRFLEGSNFNAAGLFVDYGQAALKREERAVAAVAKVLSIRVRRLRIEGFRKSGVGELAGRNSLLISAALVAARGRSCVIGIGVHACTPYYDCSERYLKIMNMLVREQTDGRVSILAPFSGWTKRDIYDYAIGERLPIDRTYSCEKGTLPTCGTCASCQDRGALGC
jgi:7-cyano-7-deazaguanine synthase